MPGWHNVELFTLPPLARSEYYVQISGNWLEEFEGWLLLPVPKWPAFAYYSDIVLRNGGNGPTIWHTPITEYAVIALLCSLAPARDGTVGAACIEPCVGGIS